MDRLETKELINFISSHPNYNDFKVNAELIQIWEEELSPFDYDDVKKNLKQYMADDKFQKQVPTVYYLIKGLTKKFNKIDFAKTTYFCPICRLAFNDRKRLEEHFDRCLSIRYISDQYKRFNIKEINKNELYDMSNEEFDINYKKVLRFVQQHTMDPGEKMRIEFIFHKPSAIEAREFFGNDESEVINYE